MPESTSQRRARLASYAPLRVTARLRCGVISDGLLPLDGALYAAAHREALGAKTASLPRASATEGDGLARHLPLKRIPIAKMPDRWTPDFYYAASAAQWPPQVAEGLDHWTKRLDSQYVELLERQRAKISTSGGTYRGYRMPVPYRHALAVTWYVVGEPLEIRRLLALVTHVGKKTAMGWGVVQDWTVEPHAQDWSVTGPDGQLMRPIPQDGGLLYGVCPPYWLPRHQVPCQIPGSTMTRDADRYGGSGRTSTTRRQVAQNT